MCRLSSYRSIIPELQSAYKTHTVNLQCWTRVTDIVTSASNPQTPQGGVGGRGGCEDPPCRTPSLGGSVEPGAPFGTRCLLY
jgi:hypothetical protein